MRLALDVQCGLLGPRTSVILILDRLPLCLWGICRMRTSRAVEVGHKGVLQQCPAGLPCCGSPNDWHWQVALTSCGRAAFHCRRQLPRLAKLCGTGRGGSKVCGLLRANAALADPLPHVVFLYLCHCFLSSTRLSHLPCSRPIPSSCLFLGRSLSRFERQTTSSYRQLTHPWDELTVY